MPDPLSEDPMVSATVSLRPPEERDVETVPVAGAGQGGAPAALQSLGITIGPEEQAEAPAVPIELIVIDRVKIFFTRAGFEVHAPFRLEFSIGGRRSQFEEFFDVVVAVDEETLLSGVTVEGGGRELPTEVLPTEIRAMVKSVAFPPPPELPGFAT